MTNSLETDNFIGLFVETMFFGILLVAVGYCLKLQLFESEQLLPKKRRDIKWWAVCGIVCAFVAATVHLILNFKLNADNLLSTKSTSQSSSDAVKYHTPHWNSAVRFTCFIIQGYVADVVLIFRLFTIYEKKWSPKVIILISIILVGAAGIIYYIGFVASHGSQGEIPKVVTIVLLCMDILLNVTATTLIVRKLWAAHTAVASISLCPNKWLLLIRIIVESGLLYIVAEVIVVVSETFGKVVVCFSGAAGPTLTISFILILIRTHDMLQRVPTTNNLSRINLSSNNCPTEATKVFALEDHLERNSPGMSTVSAVVA